MILLACLAVTAVACYYIFSVPQSVSSGPEKTRISFLQERKEAVYENLRDLNFEYKAGKVPEIDYQNMKRSLEDEAVAMLAEIAQLQSGSATIHNTKGQTA